MELFYKGNAIVNKKKLRLLVKPVPRQVLGPKGTYYCYYSTWI